MEEDTQQATEKENTVVTTCHPLVEALADALEISDNTRRFSLIVDYPSSLVTVEVVELVRERYEMDITTRSSCGFNTFATNIIHNFKTKRYAIVELAAKEE